MIHAELERITRRLDEVLEELHAHPDPRVRAGAAEFAEGIQRLHAEGLRRLAELVAEDRERFQRAMDDPVVSNLFLLYDLTFVDEEDRVRRCLEVLDPFLDAEGWTLLPAGVEDGVVLLTVHRVPADARAALEVLHSRLDEHLQRRLPGYRRVELTGLETAERASASTRADDPGWEERFRRGEPVATLPASVVNDLQRKLNSPAEASAGSQAQAGAGREVLAASSTDVTDHGLAGRLVDGYPVLLARTGADRFRAYRNACPGSLLPLHLGQRDGNEVVCPWHGCRFDLEGGSRLEGEGPDLKALPLRMDEQAIWVTLR